MSRSIAAALLLLAAPAGVAHAQAAPRSANLSPAFVGCMQRAGDNIVQRSVCASREAGGQDDRLNKAYQRVMHQLATDPAAKTALRDQERRWIEERDYSCKVNGTTIDAACVVLKTAVRADELESRVRF